MVGRSAVTRRFFLVILQLEGANAMRNLFRSTGSALVIGAALLVAGCGGGNKSTNTTNSTATMNSSAGSGLTTGNDASAMETVANAPAPVVTPGPSVTTNSAGRSTNQTGDTPPANPGGSGGDTGGNSAEKEIPGM
jgi:hypothetical protein